MNKEDLMNLLRIVFDEYAHEILKKHNILFDEYDLADLEIQMTIDTE